MAPKMFPKWQPKSLKKTADKKSVKSTVYGYYTELPQSRIVLAPKRLNSLKNVDLKSQLFIALFSLCIFMALSYTT